MWRILYQLTENFKTYEKTKFGVREEKKTSGNIRQGKLLPGRGFSDFINEFSTELISERIGVMYAYMPIASLLFMDDILLLVEQDNKQLMIDSTNVFCCKLNLKVNK